MPRPGSKLTKDLRANLSFPRISSRIFSLRGVQVMLDRDIAAFYEVKPIRLREQVKRNPGRFPEGFMFQLTEEEVSEMVSQNAIPSRQALGGSLPYAFTEQGVAALSAVLTSARAVEVGVLIVRAFVEMRKLLMANSSLFQKVDRIEIRQLQHIAQTDQKFNTIFNALENPANKTPQQGIFFNGQIFDAYVFVSDLVKSARKSIELIDNYVDESTLLILAKRRSACVATIYTEKISRQLELDLQRHNEQYPPVQIRPLKAWHDRFIVIDRKRVYHIGASLKDLGKKCFAFSLIDSITDDVVSKLPPKP
jgi:hypothetical protein